MFPSAVTRSTSTRRAGASISRAGPDGASLPSKRLSRTTTSPTADNHIADAGHGAWLSSNRQPSTTTAPSRRSG